VVFGGVVGGGRCVLCGVIKLGCAVCVCGWGC